MRPLALSIPLGQLESPGTPPLSRERCIELASQAAGGQPREVHLSVVVENADEGLPLQVAVVELRASPAGVWCLQYVSHPRESLDLTRAIKPVTGDYEAFLLHRELWGLSRPLMPHCAQEMEEEDLRPADALNLRPDNPAPVVPTRADLAQFNELAELALRR